MSTHRPLQISSAFHWFCYQLAAKFSGLLVFCTAKLHLFNVPKKIPPGAHIVVCNHISHFDPPTIASIYPRKIDFMAMRDLFANPIGWLFCKACDIFPVHREGVDGKAVRETLRRLKKGRIVCVFPEGGLRTGDQSIIGGAEPGPGAAALAQMAGVPVRVCLIIGTDQLYCRKNLFRRLPIYFKYGPELQPDMALSPKQTRTQLNAEIASAMRRLYQEFLEQIRPPEEVLPCQPQVRWERGR